ncbi:MAG: 3-hydroxyacyl-ACP dehydratase FabZ [bacterium]|nr:3-hydroxyacyl-ACP dehydratase FabZ [bacterium]
MMDIVKIQEILPHRYPFLLVDRILEINAEELKAVGIKNVSANEPFFQGHFPGKPVMPGVLITEAMGQVGAVLILSLDRFKGKIPFLASIDNLRFRKPVVPGDQLRIEVQITATKRNVGKMTGNAYVGDTLVASGEIMCSIVDKA